MTWVSTKMETSALKDLRWDRMATCLGMVPSPLTFYVTNLRVAIPILGAVGECSRTIREQSTVQ